MSNPNVEMLRPNRQHGDPHISDADKAILRKVAFNEDFVDELQAGVADDPSFAER